MLLTLLIFIASTIKIKDYIYDAGNKISFLEVGAYTLLMLWSFIGLVRLLPLPVWRSS